MNHIRPFLSHLEHRQSMKRKKLLKHEVTPIKSNLPPSISWRSKCAPVYDQAQNGTCTSNCYCAHAIAVGIQKSPSRYFHYVSERLHENAIIQDLGADLFIDNVASSIGLCDDHLMPYSLDSNGKLIGLGTYPPVIAYMDAKNHIHPALINLTPTDGSDMVPIIKQRLVDGFLVDSGWLVYQGFESEELMQTGLMSMPGPQEQIVGGHETLLIGYDDAKQMFEVQNSWGVNWGQQGFYWMPYDYFRTKNSLGEILVEEICTLPVSLISSNPDVSSLDDAINKLESVLVEFQSLAKKQKRQ